MKKLLAIAVLFLGAMPAGASEADDCGAALNELRALYEVRSVMFKGRGSSYDVDRLIDHRIDELRDPLPSGGYRWVQWVRPSGEGPITKEGHTVQAVQNAGDPDSVEASAKEVYAVKVVVPRKRSLTKANNPVYVGTLRVTYVVDGRTRTKDLAINQWMNPDTSRTLDLNAIAEHADARLDASTAQDKVKESLVEIHMREAVSEDDPANPDYETIRVLERIHSTTDPATVDTEITALERRLFPSVDPMPMLTLLTNLRRADSLIRSKKPKEQEEGAKLMEETLARLR
jgi:hypothetical protein